MDIKNILFFELLKQFSVLSRHISPFLFYPAVASFQSALLEKSDRGGGGLQGPVSKMAAHGPGVSSGAAVLEAFLLEHGARGDQVMSPGGLLPFLHEYVKTNYFTLVWLCTLGALVSFKNIPCQPACEQQCQNAYNNHNA